MANVMRCCCVIWCSAVVPICVSILFIIIFLAPRFTFVVFSSRFFLYRNLFLFISAGLLPISINERCRAVVHSFRRDRVCVCVPDRAASKSTAFGIGLRRGNLYNCALHLPIYSSSN